MEYVANSVVLQDPTTGALERVALEEGAGQLPLFSERHGLCPVSHEYPVSDACRDERAGRVGTQHDLLGGRVAAQPVGGGHLPAWMEQRLVLAEDRDSSTCQDVHVGEAGHSHQDR